ncbi:MAG: ferritin-like domain-containing protein [Planctomycetota bacterium]
MPSGRALRELWNDPERRIRTLESFSKTEEDGGLDLLAAARRVGDPELKKSLEVHARDERRHAELFRRRASELRAQAASTPRTGEDSMRAYDLVRGRAATDVDAHGFFTAGLCDELGDVAYVAMLHVAEKRAAAVFEQHRDAVPDDAATRAIFEEILNDEKFHVSYTGNFLKQWRKQGRSHEVKAALRRAKGSRFIGAWKRFGARSAGSFGRAVLWIMYWTLLLPFALFARKRKTPGGFRDGSVPTARALDSQYA